MLIQIWNWNDKLLPDNWICDFSVLWKGWEKTVGELGSGYFLGGLCPVLHPNRWREFCLQQAWQQRGGCPPPVQQQRGHPVAPAGRNVLLRLQQTQVTSSDCLLMVSGRLRVMLLCLKHWVISRRENSPWYNTIRYAERPTKSITSKAHRGKAETSESQLGLTRIIISRKRVRYGRWEMEAWRGSPYAVERKLIMGPTGLNSLKLFKVYFF